MSNSIASCFLPKWLNICTCCLLFLGGCTCGSRQQKRPRQANDSTKVVLEEKSAIPTDSLLIQAPVEPEHFDTATKHWILGALDKKQLSAGDFTPNESDTAPGNATAAPTGEANSGSDEVGNLGPVTAFTQSKDYYRDYRSVIRWSPDSSHFVDFGSYSLVVVKHPDGTTSLEGGEPDTKVVLVDPKAGKQTQVLFGGPGLHVLDVHWLDKQTFLMLYSSTYSGPADTLLFLADIAHQQSRQYQYTPTH